MWTHKIILTINTIAYFSNPIKSQWIKSSPGLVLIEYSFTSCYESEMFCECHLTSSFILWFYFSLSLFKPQEKEWMRMTQMATALQTLTYAGGWVVAQWKVSLGRRNLWLFTRHRWIYSQEICLHGYLLNNVIIFKPCPIYLPNLLICDNASS